MNPSHYLTAFAAVTLLMMISPAQAQVCEDASIQSELQYLRRLSLDLRGYLPTVEEYQRVVADGHVGDDSVDDMLGSDGFTHQVRTYHTTLLWSNLATQRLTNNNFRLVAGRGRNAGSPLSSISVGRRTAYRGGQVGCRDEPAEFDEDGSIVTIEEESPPGSGNVVRREGFVEVEPYWAPGTIVKVCAFDAQVNEVGTNQRGRPVQCSQGVAAECGCGPNLQWCFGGNSERRVLEAMIEQSLDVAVRTVTEDRPYTDVINGTNYRVNGPLTHYYKHLTAAGPNFVAASTDPGFTLPDLPFGQDEWVSVSGANYGHSGLLTLPGFLLKFQSNRGRANRFYEAFLCRSFTAPEGGLPASTDPCNEEQDLTKRCGCAFCHQAVEPAAAHWGRWSEAGVAPMPDSQFPRYNRICDPGESGQAGNNFLCRRFYITDEESPYAGQLHAYEFADDHPDRADIIEAGPARLAQTAIETGEFASCAVSRMWDELMDQPAGTADNEAIAALTTQFKNGYSLRSIIREIVTRPEYRYAGLLGQGDE
jgi:hypothetical protein